MAAPGQFRGSRDVAPRVGKTVDAETTPAEDDHRRPTATLSDVFSGVKRDRLGSR
jgi:hypothetical protein